MAEVFAVTGVFYDFARGKSTCFPITPALKGRNTGKLSGQNGLVDRFHFVSEAAEGDGSGHVGAVATELTAEVHCYEIAVLKFAAAGNAVGTA